MTCSIGHDLILAIAHRCRHGYGYITPNILETSVFLKNPRTQVKLRFYDLLRNRIGFQNIRYHSAPRREVANI